jgi:nucleoside-diphosphate-sugar epimerase
MKILITGLSGFTGPYLKEEMTQHGHEVLGLKSDLLDKNSLQREIEEILPEAVVHLAGISFVGHGTIEDFYRVNLLGTYHLLEALEKSNAPLKSLMLCSTGNVYGDAGAQGTPLSEETPPCPKNDYAVSKVAMELMAHLWKDRLPLFIVRPFNYTGAGQSLNFLVPKIVDHLLKKKSSIELGNLNVFREFSDVRTVVYLYRKLLEIAPVGQTLNVCSGIVYSLKEVLDLGEKLSGHRLMVHSNPSLKRGKDIYMLKGDQSRLKSLITDWPFFSLEDTIMWLLTKNGNES